MPARLKRKEKKCVHFQSAFFVPLFWKQIFLCLCKRILKCLGIDLPLYDFKQWNSGGIVSSIDTIEIKSFNAGISQSFWSFWNWNKITLFGRWPFAKFNHKLPRIVNIARKNYYLNTIEFIAATRGLFKEYFKRNFERKSESSHTWFRPVIYTYIYFHGIYFHPIYDCGRASRT